MHGWWADVLRGLLLFVVLPNLMFFIVGRFFFLDRPLINIDYIILGALWLWLPRWLRITGFSLIFLIDAITSTARMYNISPVAGVVALFRAPIGLLLTVIAVFAISCAIAAAIGILIDRAVTRRSPAPKRPSVLALLVIPGAVALTMAPRTATGSGTARLMSDIVQRDRGYRTRPEPMAAATDALRKRIANHEENVAIIVVESWGVLTDTSAHRELIDLFRSQALQQRYAMATGTLPFSGGTTSGELRELCGVLTDYLVLNEETARNCIPTQLKRRGFRTVALHGYKPDYYSRNVWYPRFFDRMLFQDSLAVSGRRCGTQFRGVCDRDVFQTFERELRAGQRQLTYWLTIDAHTPVDMARLGELRTAGCRATEDVCLVVAFWRDLLQNVGRLAAEPGLPPTRFIIVGDHAPAFVRQSRARYFVPGRVPFVELIPRPDPARDSRVLGLEPRR